MSEKLYDVITYRNSKRRMAESRNPVPLNRPAVVREASPGGAMSPAVRMTAAQVRAAISATEEAWQDYIAGILSPPVTHPDAAVIQGAEGTRWIIDASGKLVPA